MQARGDNLLSILKAFTNSSMLRTAHERESLGATSNDYKDERAVFFDYLSWFMVRWKIRDSMIPARIMFSFCSLTKNMTILLDECFFYISSSFNCDSFRYTIQEG